MKFCSYPRFSRLLLKLGLDFDDMDFVMEQYARYRIQTIFPNMEKTVISIILVDRTGTNQTRSQMMIFHTSIKFLIVPGNRAKPFPFFIF